MKTLIQGPGRMRFHTQFGPLFEAVGDLLEPLRWHAVGVEVHERLEGIPHDVARGECRLSGQDLARLARGKDPQFIWGVFSGFDWTSVFVLRRAKKDIHPEDPSFWNPLSGPLHPAARIEIACFDSSATIVTGADPELHRRLLAFFPEAGPMPPPESKPPR